MTLKWLFKLFRHKGYLTRDEAADLIERCAKDCKLDEVEFSEFLETPYEDPVLREAKSKCWEIHEKHPGRPGFCNDDGRAELLKLAVEIRQSVLLEQRIRIATANELIEEAKCLFKPYELGLFADHCHCCNCDDLSSAFNGPKGEDYDAAVLSYYFCGPNKVGELSDYKHFFPEFSALILNDGMHPWPLSKNILDTEPTEWTKVELIWIKQLFAFLDQNGKFKKICSSTIAHLDELIAN